MFGLHTTAIFWAGGGIIVYAVVARGLFRATDGLRASLIDLSCDLLKSPDVPEIKKELIRSALDDVHSVRSAWTIVVMLPISLIVSLFWRPPTELTAKLPGKLQSTFETFLNRWMVATITNSVMATIICGTFIVIVSAFVSSIFPIGLLIMRRRGSHAAKHAHA